jgi:hypothetical protein
VTTPATSVDPTAAMRSGRSRLRGTERPYHLSTASEGEYAARRAVALDGQPGAGRPRRQLRAPGRRDVVRADRENDAVEWRGLDTTREVRFPAE